MEHIKFVQFNIILYMHPRLPIGIFALQFSTKFLYRFPRVLMRFTPLPLGLPWSDHPNTLRRPHTWTE
jgi:hypothetical protein